MGLIDKKNYLEVPYITVYVLETKKTEVLFNHASRQVILYNQPERYGTRAFGYQGK